MTFNIRSYTNGAIHHQVNARNLDEANDKAFSDGYNMFDDYFAEDSKLNEAHG